MGELQKRIANIVWESNPRKAGYVDKLAKLFEEMKKEYPKHEQFDLPHKTDSLKVAVIDWEKTTEIMEQKNIEREKWFEKWLGER